MKHTVDSTRRNTLAHAALELSEREQERIGKDLHDGMCQNLTGVLFMGKALRDRLRVKALAEAEDVDRIVGLVQDSLAQARNLSTSLHPIEADSYGLVNGLTRLAASYGKSRGIACGVHIDPSIRIADKAKAAALYRIAQEALSHCAKHGASSVELLFKKSKGRIVLEIRDDGATAPAGNPAAREMGLRLMKYRAKIANASLEIKRLNGKGTLVRCSLPNQTPAKARQQ